MIVPLLLSRAAVVVAFGVATGTARAAPAFSTTERTQAPAESQWLDVTYKTVKLRKLAHKCFGLGNPKHLERPLELGPLHATLQWRLPWRWNESRLDRLSPHGMRGGPLVSLALPIAPWAALEAQFGSFRYLYASPQPDPQLSAFCGGLGRGRRSLEAALVFNIHFDGLL